MEEQADIVADSLVVLPADTVSLADTVFVPPAPVTARELFGAGATLAVGATDTPVEKPVYETPLFHGAVLVLAIVYSLLLARHLRDAGTLCKKLSFDRAKSYRMTEIAGGTYTRLLWRLTGIGLPLMVLLLLRVAGEWMPVVFWREIESWTWLPGGVAAAFLAAIVIAAIVLFQVGLLGLSGTVTLSQRLTAHLVALKFNYSALGTLLLAPLALFYLLAEPGQDRIMLYAISAAAGVLLALFLKESVSLFLREKVSLLHWFLYLCAVEILPVSFFCILAGRSVSF